MSDEEPVGALLRVLEEERSCLLAGQVDELAALGSKKQALIERVIQRPLDRSQLIRLAGEMAHQGNLLVACRDGLQAAQKRLSELKSVQSGLCHYTKEGKVRKIDACTAEFEKRA